jgi:hypothetical protein
VAVIVPRWEWRVFGPGFGAAEEALAGLGPGPVQESEELYLLSPAGANVKVRDGLMDIKLLQGVDGDGLERWEPVLKAGFPLPAAEVARVFQALEVAAPALGRDAYSLEQLLAELLEPSDAVRVVRVHKRRVRYRLGACMAETAQMEADGRTQPTVAVESEDPAAVLAAVRRLGLDGHVNTSYPRALAALVAGSWRHAVIDVGSRGGQRSPGPGHDRAVRAGLGAPEGSLVVFDTGGGSSQFTFGRGPEVEERFSLPVGAVRHTERFGLAGVVGPSALDDALAAIAADLAPLDGRPPPDALVAMGGAVTNMTAVKLGLAAYDPELVQGAVLDRAEVDRQIELYRSRDAEARRVVVGLQPKRAEVILAGACIVRTVMDKLGQQRLTVSDRGLRHGPLIDRFGG